MAPEVDLLESLPQAGQGGSSNKDKSGQAVAKPKDAGVAKDDKEPSTKAANVEPTRTDSFSFGIPQNGLQKKERVVALNEPPPLAPNAELTYIGKPTVRYDGPAKAMGKGRYTADIHLPGMLYARMVDATTPHGRILSVDTSAAEKVPGVRAVHVIEHVFGVAELRDPKLEAPSRYPIIRYAGQPIAAVAATSPQIADDAAKLIEVTYDPMGFVVDRMDARAADAPVVFPGPADAAGSAGGGGGPKGVPQKGNVHGPQRKVIGDVAHGFADADVVVDSEYFTQVQTHSALETHGFVVDWKPEEVTVYASTQGTSSVRDEFADVFKLPKAKVRVITEYMGGGFGAKFGAGNEGVVAAHLSRKANAPVKLMLDRRQEHIVCNRPDSHQQLKIGAKRDGTLTAIELVSYGTAGVGTGAGTAGPATNMYKAPNLLTEEYDVFVNAGPGAAFRAPGHPQGCFALEQAIDELAVKLNMDPMTLRDKIDENPARRAERQIILEKTNWRNRRPAGADKGPIKRGIGMAQSIWYRFISMNSSCEIRVHKDGTVELLSAVQDLGTGTKTLLAVVVAEEFGIPPEQVVIRIGDTRFPIGPDSGGSVTAGSITPAVRNAAWEAKQKLFAAAAPGLGTSASNLTIQNSRILLKDDPSRTFSLKQVTSRLQVDEIAVRATRVPEYSKDRITYGGVDYVELAVDTETGRVHIEKVIGAHDCGRPINPTGVISQINGGVLQGISYALFEQRIMDRNAGYMLNANLENYKILGAREVPEIEIHLVENYLAQSSTDAAGIGESAGIITLAAAIGNAFYNATGVRMRSIPMTPARVLTALGKVPAGAGEEARMNNFAFVDCRTVDQALGELTPTAVVKAGGIDLLDLMKEDIVSPAKLVNIRNVDSLRGITIAQDGLHLGPLSTLAEIAAHPDIQRTYAGLADAAGHAATPQVRNMATLGGNIMQRPRCWYFRSSDFNCKKKGGTSDDCHAHEGENQYHAVLNNGTCAMVHPSSTAVPLLAMNARIELTSKHGKRVVGMDEFYVPPEKSLINETVVKPGELITNVFVPAPEPGTRSAYQKYGEKESFDWPLADAGVVLVMEGSRCKKASVVLGVAAPTPVRATAAEAMLAGKTIDETLARAAAKAAMQGATPLSQNGYKTQLFQTAIYRTVLLAAGQMQRDPSAIG